MDKKYQVFISSTYTDMKDERQTAVQAILDAGHIPAGMELFAASDKKQIDVIKRWIDRSDVFMLILGGRYGSVEGDSGKSYIQLEYEYAIETGKPLFALYLTDDAIDQKVKKHGRDVTEKGDTKSFNEFRMMVMAKMCRAVDDNKDILIEVPRAIRDLAEGGKLEGWVRASAVPDFSPLIAEMAALRKENDELKKRKATSGGSIILTPSVDLEGIDMSAKVSLDVGYTAYDDQFDSVSKSDKWLGTYEEIFSLIAPKLLEEPSDSDVQDYVANVISEAWPDSYNVNVRDTGFQALKVRLVTYGVVELKRDGKSLCWALTDAGKTMMLKHHGSE